MDVVTAALEIAEGDVIVAGSVVVAVVVADAIAAVA